MIEQAGPSVVNSYRQLIEEMFVLTSFSEPEVILEYISSAAARLTDSELAWVLVPDHLHKELRLKYFHPFDGKKNHDDSIPFENSLESWVLANQRAVMVNGLETYDRSMGEMISLPGIIIKSLIALPITLKNKRYAVLEVANKVPGDFTSFDLELLEKFSHFSAICYEKSQRFIQTELIPELVHELRTPLAALNTALHLLQRTDLSDAKREHISRMIQTEFNRLSDMTTSFLDYARLESGKDKFIFTDFNFSQLIRECLDIIQIHLDGKDIKITTNISDVSMHLTGDRDKLKQVVLNLLTNAIKYNPSGGMIHVNAIASPTHVIFSVQDNGPGIAPEYLPRLFERFYRLPNTERQIKGTGLGLTICKHIINAHGGEIEVSSNLGQGSIFTVRLPVNMGSV